MMLPKVPRLLPVALFFVLVSCGPRVYYLGDSYAPSSSVEIYYNAAQVKRDYITIGHMTKELYKAERDKTLMVEEAKKRGADAIIFSDLSLDRDKKEHDLVTVKAELIKFR